MGEALRDIPGHVSLLQVGFQHMTGYGVDGEAPWQRLHRFLPAFSSTSLGTLGMAKHRDMVKQKNRKYGFFPMGKGTVKHKFSWKGL